MKLVLPCEAVPWFLWWFQSYASEVLMYYSCAGYNRKSHREVSQKTRKTPQINMMFLSGFNKTDP